MNSGSGMTATDAYNYEAFNFGLEPAEFEGWLQGGPAIGSEAPDFEVSDLEGESVQLSALRGRPVVLEFGCYTCPMFSDRIPAMEELARAHSEVTFLVVYVREAHPGEVQGPHHSLADKRAAARKLVVEEALERRVLIDTIDGAVHRAYGGAWNPVYLIGADGGVVMRLAWNNPELVAAVLDSLQAGILLQVPESVEMLREPGRKPMGLRLLERGGPSALEDFYRSAPQPVREALRTSPAMAVRDEIAGFESEATRPGRSGLI